MKNKAIRLISTFLTITVMTASTVTATNALTKNSFNVSAVSLSSEQKNNGIFSTQLEKKSSKPIYTGNVKVDLMAEKIIKAATKNKKMSNYNKLKAAYFYLVKHMKYTNHGGRKYFRLTKAEKKQQKIITRLLRRQRRIKVSKRFHKDFSHLLSMRGKCKYMSGVMCILANHLGYKANIVHGRYKRSNGTSISHYFNYVKVRGVKLYCDVQASNDSYKHSGSLKKAKKYCLKKKSNRYWRKHHAGC